MDVDPDRLNAFMGKMLGDISAAINAALGTTKRCIRKWLSAQSSKDSAIGCPLRLPPPRRFRPTAMTSSVSSIACMTWAIRSGALKLVASTMAGRWCTAPGTVTETGFVTTPGSAAHHAARGGALPSIRGNAFSRW
jgi:hypothetical protein